MEGGGRDRSADRRGQRGTADLYQTVIRAYVVPHIGERPLQELAPAHLTALCGQLMREGGRGGRPLAPKTVRNVHTTLHRALGDALKWGSVMRNAA